MDLSGFERISLNACAFCSPWADGRSSASDGFGGWLFASGPGFCLAGSSAALCSVLRSLSLLPARVLVFKTTTTNTTTTKPQHNNNKTTTQQQQSKTTKTCRHEWRHGTSGDVRHFRIAFEECYAPAAVRRPAVAGPSLALWALNLIEGPLAPIVYDFGFLPRGEPQGGALQTFFRHEKTGSARLEPPRLIHLKSARGGSPTKRRATRTVLAKQRSC